MYFFYFFLLRFCYLHRKWVDDYILIIFSIKRLGRGTDVCCLLEMNYSLRYLLKMQFQEKKS